MPAPLVLLEFDDVLAETRGPRLAALRAALAPDGVTLGEDTWEHACAGLSTAGAVRQAYRAALAPVDETAIELATLRASRDFAATAARGLPLAPGARDFIRLGAGKARFGIVTRAERRDVELVLSLADLADEFECVITAEDYTGPEPSPQPYDTAVFRMAHRSAVTIGDGIALVASLNAVAAARAARLHPIVVGPVSPGVAFAGEGYLPTLEGARVRDVLRLAARAQAR